MPDTDQNTPPLDADQIAKLAKKEEEAGVVDQQAQISKDASEKAADRPA